MKRGWFHVSAILVLIAVLSLSAHAANKDYIKEYFERYERAFDKCVKEVQKELPYSSFDAYYEKGKDMIHMFGSAEARFKFEKCLTKSGYPPE